jgi:hypothetical protein
MCIGPLVNFPLIMKIKFSGRTFEKYLNIIFNENPSSGADLFHADRRKEGQTDVTKLRVVFHNFACAPN